MNFKTFVIAGLGTIGSGLLRLGKETLDTFEHLIAVDRSAEKLNPQPGLNLMYRQGDIEEVEFLRNLFRDIRLPALFVNLCSGVDNVRVRKIISQFDVAYIDSCASEIYREPEYRFTRLMPYTLLKTDSSFPHWLCWGINPGLVEIISRRIMERFGDKNPSFDVSIFEFDQLRADLNDSKIAVGWSPEALVEEVMISPSFWVTDKKQVEIGEPGTRKILSFWKEKPVLSRIVGHEDVWNIGKLTGVNSAEFVYALDPKVMEAFEGGTDDALDLLKVPGADVPVFGMEQVAVKVKTPGSGKEKILVWAVEHEDVWRRHKINAVQYQTGKSLLLAIELLQRTRYGRLPLNCCAADLPISGQDWENIEHLMTVLNICWTDATALALRTAPLEDDFYVST
jgi:hypothetical protein